MTEPWRIRLLGGLGAFRGGDAVTRFRTQKTGGLLAYLAFYGGRVHPREMLMEVLWPESDLDAARNSLSVALNSLRRQLEPPATPGTAPVGVVLIADRNTVRLNPDAFTTDVSAFKSALEDAGRSETPSEILESLTRADQLYTGELLPGFYDDWVLAERESLADTHRQVLRRLTTLLMQMRDFDRALEYAHRAVEADPLNETARHLLMRLYASIGRPAAVMEQLQEWEHLLETAGEGSLSSATRTLALRLAEGTDKETGGDLVALSSPSGSPAPPAQPGTVFVAATPRPSGNQASLPAPFTRFFGRDDEIASISSLLRTETIRLVTLTGPGGVGKTRLAIEASDRLHGSNDFTGGIWFVPLADVAVPERFFDAVRDSLHLSRTSPSTNAQEQVSEFLTARTGSCLLVLDNLEHLLRHGSLDPNGVAQATATLLARVPNLTLLATSRESLGIVGETEFPATPLPVPPDPRQPPEILAGYASVSLFVDRARARRVDFQITPRNAGAIARLCACLDGNPLAIELAAARAKLYTPSQMLDRLSEGFALLESNRPDIPARHRSLRATAAWSVELLSPAVRQLFARLSVFRGGCTVEAAAAVCAEGDDESPDRAGQTIEGLARLRDASLLIAEETAIGGAEEMRLRLREPLREYAAALLTESDTNSLTRRHAAYFLSLAEESAKRIQGPDQHIWFDRLEADHDNIRAALTRFVETEIGLEMAGALARFWMVRGHLAEGATWLDRALAATRSRGETSSSEMARALNGAGMLAYDRDDYEAARTFYEESLAVQRVIGDRLGIATALNNLGNVAYRQKDYPTARKSYEESLAVHRAENHRWGIASALGNLGNIAQAEGDNVSARALHEESLALSREIGDTRMTAYTLHNLGNMAQEEDDFARSRSLHSESLELKRGLGDQRGVAALLITMAFLELQASDYPAAQERLTEAVPLAREIGAARMFVFVLEGMGWIASVGGEPLLAARLWGAASSARDILNFPYPPQEQAAYTPLFASARQATSDHGFDTAWSEGGGLSLDDAIDLALREMASAIERP